MTVLESTRLRRLARLGALVTVAVLTAVVLAGPVAAHHGKGAHAGDSTPKETRYDVSLTLRDSAISTDVTFTCLDCADGGLGFKIFDLDPQPRLMERDITDVFFEFHHKKGVLVWLTGLENGVERLYNSCLPEEAKRCWVPATTDAPGGVITLTVGKLVDMIRTHAPDKGEVVGQVFVVDAVFTPHVGP